MENSPELNQKGKYLGSITRDFATVSNALKEAADALRDRNISQFPIFPICRRQMAIGLPLIRKEEAGVNWHYNFSFLEEFVDRKLVDKDRIEDFMATYKNPEEFCCLFVVDNDFVNFVYIPYPED
jgi:hypothetical protein